MIVEPHKIHSPRADICFAYAPGKVILAGEHAVVYGQPALALTLDKGIRIAVSKRREHQGCGPILRAGGLGFVGSVRLDPKGSGPQVLRLALKRLVSLCGERVSDLMFTVDSTIPGGCGLGSSAALSVALIRAVHNLFGQELSAAKTLSLAMDLEGIFHGNPSGLDHTVISTGGLIRFAKRSKQNCIEKIEPKRSLKLAVGVAGPHGGTSKAVGALKERIKHHEGTYGHIFSGIGQVVDEMSQCISEGKLAAVGELMDLNQGYLSALGVSTLKLEAMCSIARQRGALGAKLTGAGFGGAVIALCDEDPASVVQAFEAAGYLSFATEYKTD